MRVVRIVVQDGDDMPDNPHTLDGALRVIRWAAPDLTEDEAVRVRDVGIQRHEDMSTTGLLRLIREVLGANVDVQRSGPVA